jgi:hypothetical protein
LFRVASNESLEENRLLRALGLFDEEETLEEHFKHDDTYTEYGAEHKDDNRDNDAYGSVWPTIFDDDVDDTSHHNTMEPSTTSIEDIERFRVFEDDGHHVVSNWETDDNDADVYLDFGGGSYRSTVPDGITVNHVNSAENNSLDLGMGGYCQSLRLIDASPSNAVYVYKLNETSNKLDEIP